MIKNWFKNMGPGPLIAAAFIGPGTVTVCTLAGVSFGFALLWSMVLSIVATLVLQEMSARLGIITQKGLAEIIRAEVKNPFLKSLIVSRLLYADIPPHIINRIFLFSRFFICRIKIPIVQKLQELIIQ